MSFPQYLLESLALSANPNSPGISICQVQFLCNKLSSTYLITLFLLAGSPAILGDHEEDGDAGEDYNYSPEDHTQKEKIAERMLSWHMTYGQGENVAPANYDGEVSHNHIPQLTSRQEVV